MLLGGPFLGVEALDAGLARKHHLRSTYAAIFPGVYLRSGVTPTFRQRAEAAWLWSRRRGVLCGLTAARLHGAKWVDDALPIELMWSNGRPPPGIRVRKDNLNAAEHGLRVGLPVTTVLRTAYDLGRRGLLSEAVERLDALGNAAGFAVEDVHALASGHRGARGLCQLYDALNLHDFRAQSPKETWLRLLVIGAGFPPPRTQIPVVVGGRTKYYLDMGWEHIKVALEYEGDHHRTDRAQFARDIVRLDEVVTLGWTIIRVAADTPPEWVIARVRQAWEAASRVH